MRQARSMRPGLGRIGGDLLDAELLESASELGRSLFSGELLG